MTTNAVAHNALDHVIRLGRGHKDSAGTVRIAQSTLQSLEFEHRVHTDTLYLWSRKYLTAVLKGMCSFEVLVWGERASEIYADTLRVILGSEFKVELVRRRFICEAVYIRVSWQ
jgi:hypothetical protein